MSVQHKAEALDFVSHMQMCNSPFALTDAKINVLSCCYYGTYGLFTLTFAIVSSFNAVKGMRFPYSQLKYICELTTAKDHWKCEYA